MVASWVLIAAASLMADGVSTKFIGKGVTAKLGGYRPLRAEMNGKPELVKNAPEGLSAPKYGEFKLDGRTWTFILDEPEGQPAKLFVDTNGDGDLTNDPAPKWEPGPNNMHRGEAQVELNDKTLGTLGLYRFDPNDSTRKQLANTLMFYTDFGFEVIVELDGKSYSSLISGAPSQTSSFWIDRDGNKQTSYKLEMVRVGRPFNFTGTTYVLNLNNGELALEKSKEELPQLPLPPDIRVGKKAIPFEAETTDGEKIKFPQSYAGKVVLVDFWATWCGPCIRELPNLKKAYEDHHDKGFEVLGISFDRDGMKEKLAAFTKKNEMPWPQIYEGKYWETSLGEAYDVSSIPFVLLVDGDTGEILATTRKLRGPGLTEFVKTQLAKKKSDQKVTLAP